MVFRNAGVGIGKLVALSEGCLGCLGVSNRHDPIANICFLKVSVASTVVLTFFAVSECFLRSHKP